MRGSYQMGIKPRELKEEGSLLAQHEGKLFKAA